MHAAARRPPRAEIEGLRLAATDLAALRARVERLPLARRRRLPDLKAGRAEMIVAGAVILEEVVARGGYPGLTICEQGVRHGILLRETFGGEGAG
jgi:exopolyphosphatase/guanosine-5'-triphosphate,3'-diphosphate pyrophosphatase